VYSIPAINKGCWRKLAEIQRIAAVTLEPDPGNAGVGMKIGKTVFMHEGAGMPLVHFTLKGM